MLVEETVASSAQDLKPPQLPETLVEEADTLDEPHPPGLYNDFLKQQESREEVPDVDMGDTEQPRLVPRPKRKRDVGTTSSAAQTGPLSKFVKPPDSSRVVDG
jgi:hypothetical protein